VPVTVSPASLAPVTQLPWSAGSTYEHQEVPPATKSVMKPSAAAFGESWPGETPPPPTPGNPPLPLEQPAVTAKIERTSTNPPTRTLPAPIRLATIDLAVSNNVTTITLVAHQATFASAGVILVIARHPRLGAAPDLTDLSNGWVGAKRAKLCRSRHWLPVFNIHSEEAQAKRRASRINPSTTR
jgi:hypothetical protein